MRRERFAELAAAHGSILIEDDYDSEFHWRGQEIPALGATPGAANVATIGTVSKALVPELRLAWIVAPQHMVAPIVSAQRSLGLLANIHAQAALANMLARGEWNRHLRHLARVYGERERALADLLVQLFDEHAHVHLPDGGLQLTVRFREPLDETSLLDALARHGAMPDALSSMCVSAQLTGRTWASATWTKHSCRNSPRSWRHFVNCYNQAISANRVRPN